MKAVVLFNLGGPDTLDDVQGFLFNLFRDPDIIRLPWVVRFLQRPIANFISSRRREEAQENYKKIGGGSPLLAETRRQADGLAKELGDDYRVFIAMRYWTPDADQVVKELQALEPEEIILLPLYPQYSIATTGSSMNDFERALRQAQWNPKRRLITQWYDRLPFQQIIARQIEEKLEGCDLSSTHVLFSAHGLPETYITKLGDPYERQIHETVGGVMAQLRVPVQHSICYQSRVGPVKWLGPDTEQAIADIAKGGTRHIVVYPIAFVSEHIETLFELDMLYGDLARELKVDYRRVFTVRDKPEFLAFLADLVREAPQDAAAESPASGESLEGSSE